MSNSTKSMQHITAATITANAGQYRQELQRTARGVDAFARQTGRRYQELKGKVDAFDAAVTRGMKHARQQVQRESKAMQKALQGVNFHAGGMAGARQQMGAIPMAGKGGGSMLRTAAGYASPIMAYSAVMKSKDFERRVADVFIKGGKDQAWGDSLSKQIIGISNATGKSRDELMDFVQQYTELTGNADAARGMLGDLAKVAVATNAPMGDLAEVVEQLSGSLKIAAKDMPQAMNIISHQEKLGKVPFAAIAGQISKLTSQGQLFGRSGEGLAATQAMGGLFQMAARGKGRDQLGTAATSAQRFLGYTARNAGKIEKAFGVKLGRQDGKQFIWKPLSEVFQIIGEAVAKNPDVMAKNGELLFGMFGKATALELGAAAKAGWHKNIGDRSSAASILGAGGVDMIGQDYKKRMGSKAQRWDIAVARMSNKIHETMLPVLEELIKVMPELAKALEFLLNNSGKLISLWMGAKGAAFMRSVMATANAVGGGPGVVPGGAPGGAPGVLVGRTGIPYMKGSDAYILEQARQRRAARWAGVRRVAGMGLRGGATLGAVGGQFIPGVGGQREMVGDTAASMAMMTGNPYAAAAGGGYYLGKLIAPHVVAERLAESLNNAMAEAATLLANHRSEGLRDQMVSAKLRDFYGRTERGAVLRRDITGSMDSLLGQGADGNFTFNPGALVQSKGRAGARNTMASIRTQYEALKAQGTSILAEGGIAATQENLEKRIPMLGVLRRVMESIDSTLATLAGGGGIQVNAKVNIPNPNAPTPGSRANSRAPEPSVDSLLSSI